MRTIERSVDVDAEITDADREWTEFMLRSLVGHYRTTAEDVEWSLAEDVEQSGLVTMARHEGGRTRVTVAVECVGDAAAEAAVGAHLERGLKEFQASAETRG